LRAAIAGYDLAELKNYIAKAEEIQLTQFLDEKTKTAMTNRVDFLTRRDAATAGLEDILGHLDSPKIERALQLAQEAEVDATVIRKAEKRLLELEGMRTQAHKRLLAATKGRDSDGIKAAIKDAERLKAASSEELRKAQHRRTHLNAERALIRTTSGYSAKRLKSALDGCKKPILCDVSLVKGGQQRLTKLEKESADKAQVLNKAIKYGETNPAKLRKAIMEAEQYDAASPATIATAKKKLQQLETKSSKKRR